MNRRDWCKNALLGANILASASADPGSLRWARQTHQIENEFFAMDTAILRTLDEVLTKPDLEAVAKLHYRGVAVGALNAAEWQHLVEAVLPWLDETGLKLYAVYSWAHVDREQFTIDAGIKANLPKLKDRKAAIWPLVTSKSLKPSDLAGDAMAVTAVRQMADDAAEYGCSVSLYPHASTLIERVGDAVRIADKANRHNVGVTFNLCHCLKTDGPDSVDSALKLAMPKLSLVTINGANREGHDWKQFIQPLDQGNFDIGALLRELNTLGYRGPIGLQGYDVANNFHIEPIENLKRSMAAWTKLVSNSRAE